MRTSKDQGYVLEVHVHLLGQMPFFSQLSFQQETVGEPIFENNTSLEEDSGMLRCTEEETDETQMQDYEPLMLTHNITLGCSYYSPNLLHYDF